MRGLGHTDPAFTLRLYAQTMRGGADERERLRELADGTKLSVRRHPSSNARDAIPHPERNGSL